jgi:DNA-binding beta-propeller fold protein YncE
MESGKYNDPEQFNPTAVAVGPDGRIFVADGYGRNWVHVFSPGLEYIKSFGGPGAEPGQFQTCHGLAVDTRGERPLLIVCDRENRRLQRFDLDGNFVDVPIAGLRRPCAIAMYGDYTAVAELEGRVTILDKDGDVIARLGDNPVESQWANNGVPSADWVPGVFTAPHAVCFDEAGNLYVMDWNATGRISKLRRVGENAAPRAERRP